jgi:hypothetical protein
MLFTIAMSAVGLIIVLSILCQSNDFLDWVVRLDDPEWSELYKEKLPDIIRARDSIRNRKEELKWGK